MRRSQIWAAHFFHVSAKKNWRSKMKQQRRWTRNKDLSPAKLYRRSVNKRWYDNNIEYNRTRCREYYRRVIRARIPVTNRRRLWGGPLGVVLDQYSVRSAVRARA